jgi:hypothetical protein
MTNNKILSITEVHNVGLSNSGPLHGKNNARLGMTGMISALSGGGGYDGFFVKTEIDEYAILISNGQDCCENWGYLDTNDNSKAFIGANLLNVSLVDSEYATKLMEQINFYTEEENQICFVNFETDRGTFQLAVYNSHNGYYGHSILVAKNSDIIHSDTL